ncbi:lysophospholipid acyltransferase family protein [Chitinimonas koreensis]|uniref:lysophospholipid acyltransferase family protein n=1 Tax=Chitinimonas koreensis TaxID=356302 RepID=UPI00048B319F|nr:lysophospholipid acyltransferase family protein [Chitinimonas koreensis]
MNLTSVLRSGFGRRLSALPIRLYRGIGWAVGSAHYLADASDCRSDILPLIRDALGVGFWRGHAIAWRAVVTSTLYAFDSAYLLHAPARRLERLNASRNRCVGEDRLAAAMAHGRGVVLAASNFSCFYYGMMAPLAGAAQAEASQFTLVRPPVDSADPLFDALYRRTLAIGGRPFQFIETGDRRAALDFLLALRRNRVVVCMVDYVDADLMMVPAPFFGRPSCLAAGALMMADKTGSPVLTCTTRYVGGGFETRFGEPIDPADCPHEDRVSWLADRLNAALEQDIVEAPGKWGAWGSLRAKWYYGEQIAAAE